MANLKAETLKALTDYGYTPEDVEQVQGCKVRISWDRFLELADVEYDAGYGSQQVATDLTILMKDGAWFTRGEYDGSEWWSLHRRPARAEENGDYKVFSLVCRPGRGWCCLEDINGLDAGEKPSKTDIEALDDWCIERKIKWNLMGSRIELIFGPHLDLDPDWVLQLRRVDGCPQYDIIDDDGAVRAVAADMSTALDRLDMLMKEEAEDGR